MKGLRVLHLNTEEGWRGGENQLRLLINGLTKSGICNHLLLANQTEAMRRLSSKAETVVWRRGFLFLPLNLMRVIAFCRRHNIQLLHAHSSKTHSLGLLLSTMLPGLKLVVHRRVDDRPQNHLFHRWKYSSKSVQRYLAVSQAVAFVLSDYGVSNEKIDVIPSGISLAEFPGREKRHQKHQLAQSLGFNAHWPLIGNLGALTRQKDHATLIRAAYYLKTQSIDAVVVIAGKGKLRGNLEKLISRFNLNDRVFLIDQLKDPRTLLAASDIFVLSSRNEGLGTSLLEAAAMDCTLVATQVGGIPEFVIPGRTGLLVRPFDYEAIARGIMEVLKDPERAADMRRQAREHLERHFTSEMMTSSVLKSYGRCLHVD